MSEKKDKIKLFEEKNVRTEWDEENEKYWFSVVDICAVLTDSEYQTARKYWKVLKGRIAKEGGELVTTCYQLKMQASDGKYCNTYVTETETGKPAVSNLNAKDLGNRQLKSVDDKDGDGGMSGWYKDLPQNWCEKRLGNLLSERKEKNNPVKTDFILSLSAQHGVLPYSERGSQGNKHKEDLTGYNIAKANDLLVNNMNVVIGSSGMSKWDGAISPVYYALYPCSPEINIKYYEYVFRHKPFYLSLVGLGSGILDHRMRIPMMKLKNVILPVPPRNEQDQIVRYLEWKVSQVNKLVNAKKRQIGLLKEQKQAVVRDAVTNSDNEWSMRRIKLIAKIIRGKFSHRPRNDPAFYDGEYPFIQTGEVASAGKYINSYNQTLNDKGFSVSKMFPKGTLTMTIAANIGDVAILNFDACFPDSIIGFIPEDGIDLDYLYYALYNMKSDFLREAPVNTQGNLNVERVGALTINAPSYERQCDIAKTIDGNTERLDTIIEKINNEISLLAEYRTRLISDVVTGKFDVQGVAVPEYEVEEITSDISDETDEMERY
ncbi:MAG: restriction endonuclease subunit S [Oscillospiraceae bacterium]|nr:restriction endonuclease subunit S [Oscillospiraceae bacterium]MCL2279298.1 restriction endonuclease subunit S [Oscillospiraceae bacterium]